MYYILSYLLQGLLEAKRLFIYLWFGFSVQAFIDSV